MGILSIIKDERLVAVSVGVVALSSLLAMRACLLHYRDEVEIKPEPPKAQYITQETEDSLKLDTLETLLNHYNFAIRDTALKIVAGRAVNDASAIDDLLWGITRENYEERLANISALVFAVEERDNYQEPVSILNSPKAYSALVRSLELCLDDAPHEPLDDPLYDEYHLRDIAERRCLLLISQLVHKFGVDKLVEAKFVEKWLAKQPWGENEQERRKNFDNYINRRKNRISDICHHLRTSTSGSKALAKTKLTNRTKRSKRDKSDHIKVVLEISMGRDGDDADNVQYETPGVRTRSAAEQRLRRMHREAMVLIE
ncbi:hypothetical protein F5Y15DRAFT_18642 [Xylariaceae sp. FL0016]|nr:hypothetical protein F5Y15DRAFT_18642 [Xylariaceae sp. FL0016]